MEKKQHVQDTDVNTDKDTGQLFLSRFGVEQNFFKKRKTTPHQSGQLKLKQLLASLISATCRIIAHYSPQSDGDKHKVIVISRRSL